MTTVTTVPPTTSFASSTEEVGAEFVNPSSEEKVELIEERAPDRPKLTVAIRASVRLKSDLPIDIIKKNSNFSTNAKKALEMKLNSFSSPFRKIFGAEMHSASVIKFTGDPVPTAILRVIYKIRGEEPETLIIETIKGLKLYQKQPESLFDSNSAIEIMMIERRSPNGVTKVLGKEAFDPATLIEVGFKIFI